jgi:hypothetical protein
MKFLLLLIPAAPLAQPPNSVDLMERSDREMLNAPTRHHRGTVTEESLFPAVRPPVQNALLSMWPCPGACTEPPYSDVSRVRFAVLRPTSRDCWAVRLLMTRCSDECRRFEAMQQPHFPARRGRSAGLPASFSPARCGCGKRCAAHPGVDVAGTPLGWRSAMARAVLMSAETFAFGNRTVIEVRAEASRFVRGWARKPTRLLSDDYIVPE